MEFLRITVLHVKIPLIILIDLLFHVKLVRQKLMGMIWIRLAISAILLVKPVLGLLAFSASLATILLHF